MSTPTTDAGLALAPRAGHELLPASARALVRVGERFYAGELRVTLALIVLAAGVAAVVGALGALGSASWRSVALAVLVAVFALVAIPRSEELYTAMRARPLLGMVPAALIGTMLALDGGLDSPLYIPAQAAPVMAALTGSVALAVGASGVMGSLYLVGVAASGRTLSGEDQFLVAASVLGFVAWAGLFGYFAHALTAFVMRLPLVATPGALARRPKRVRIGVQAVVSKERPADEPSADMAFRLTARQIQVAVLVAEGMTSAEIARELGIAPATVDRHVTAAMRRAGTASRSHLAALVSASGLASQVSD